MKLSDTLGLKRDAMFRAAQLGGLKVGATLSARALGEQFADEGFADWQVTAFRALVDAICEPGDSGFPAPEAVDASGVALRYIRWMPEVTREKLGNLIATLEGGPLLLGPRRVRFSELAPDERATYLKVWSEHRLPPMRAAFHAIKQVAMMGYYSQPGTWASIGYSIRENPGAPERIKGAG